MPGSRSILQQLEEVSNLFFDAASRPRRPTHSSMRSFRTPPIRASSRAGGSRSTPVSRQSWRRSSARLSRLSLRRWRTTTLPLALLQQAVAYWLKAGQQALKRSANLEAVAHLGKGLELIASLPDSESRLRQELHLQSAMGVAMMATRGWGAPEVLQAFTRARALCEKLGDTRPAIHRAMRRSLVSHDFRKSARS